MTIPISFLANNIFGDLSHLSVYKATEFFGCNGISVHLRPLRKSSHQILGFLGCTVARGPPTVG